MLTMKPNRFTTLAALAPAAIVIAAGTAHAQDDDMTQRFHDADIVEAVNSDLFYNWKVDSDTIDVTAKDGVVTLDGSVSTLQAKRRAVDIARSIRGVRSVVDLLDVDVTDRTDTQIRTDVHNALRENPATASREVYFEVSNGMITISGEAESMAEKWLIEDVIAGINGVRGINNEMTVNVPISRPDAEIKTEVEQRLERSVWVDDLPILVDVRNGEVHLTGTVGSAAERMTAKRLAYVGGVEEVTADELIVTGLLRDEGKKLMTRPAPNWTDEDVTGAITDALRYDPRVGVDNVKIRTQAGKVTLNGTVASLAAKNAAEEAARNTMGVDRVVNHIKVRPEATPTDTELANKVRESIERDSTLNRAGVIVNADGGRITLTGDVKSRFEKKRATEIASNVSGVTSVNNKLSYDTEWTFKPDWEITEEIRDQFFWSPFVDSDDVTVMVENGIAIVSGTVDDAGELDAVIENAWEGGPKDVRLKVEYEAADTD